ncbi:hypothetical protein [Thalassotalea piscium]|uniref:hypothetical protein n=1 Tax=Thalassotalea piscium TaxID=1230533 RepID=UPI0036D81D09
MAKYFLVPLLLMFTCSIVGQGEANLIEKNKAEQVALFNFDLFANVSSGQIDTDPLDSIVAGSKPCTQLIATACFYSFVQPYISLLTRHFINTRAPPTLPLFN